MNRSEHGFNETDDFVDFDGYVDGFSTCSVPKDV